MSPARPAALLLLLVVLGVLAGPCCCSTVRRDVRDNDATALLMGQDSIIVRPNRPKVFTSPEELRGYLEALSNYYAIAGRPRFGKRAPSSSQSIYDMSNFRHVPNEVYDSLDTSQGFDEK